MENLIIIGSGPAGLTAAIYAARAELAPLIFEGPQPGGQLMGTSTVENFPGFPDGISSFELMEKMRAQAKKFGAKNIFEKIDRVDFSDEKNFQLFAGAKKFAAKSVIIATGATARFLNLENEKKFFGRGYSACATCDGAFFREKIVGVVGGGDSACEEAQFLTKFAKKVFLIYRKKKSEMRASVPMKKRIFENSKIEILENSVVKKLIGEKFLEKIEIFNGEKKYEKKIDGLFVAVGREPQTEFLGEILEKDATGYLRVFEKVKTKIPGIFAAGDAADPIFRQAIFAAGNGAAAAIAAEKFLAEK